MNEKNLRKLKRIVYALIVVFILIPLSIFMLGESNRAVFISLAFISWVLFFLLGAILIYLTLKLKIEGRLKVFLLLTGISSAGFLIGVILHNLVYALFIYLFGEGFWGNGDEPIFFILAIIVCPIVFIIGAIGSIVLFRKKRKMR